MRIFTNSRYQEIIIHDLRTPLNVIMLALRMIDDTMSLPNDDMSEDLGLIRANAVELERMLSVVVEMSHVPEDASGLAPGRFDPARLARDLVDSHAHQPGAGPITLEAAGAPPVALLDETLAHKALNMALLNTITAAQGKPVRVVMEACGDRLMTRIHSAAAPRASVRSQSVSSGQFERVLGTPAERRGLDLSVVARISELFGGTTSLEARPGEGTSITLDWPLRIQKSE